MGGIITGGTYFSGGEGVGVAMRARGIEHRFGVEYDDAVANVARMNGFEMLTADVCDVDPASLPYVDDFHASPVCKNASNAKVDGKESTEDIATAEAVCRYIRHHKPRVFTLENVWGYRNFQAFQNILKTLDETGYNHKYWHLNSANYGVPQTRKRLVLVAARDFVPHRPQETHTKEPAGIFDYRKPWVGWYEAIADLIPTLPESKFANWQLERLPEELRTVLMGGGNRSHSFLEWAKENRPDTPGKRFKQEPSHAVSATGSSDMRAFIVSSTEQRVETARTDNEPMRTLKAEGDRMPRAFIVDGKLGSYGENMTIRDGEEPFFTVTNSHNQRDLKAFMMQVQGLGGDGIREQDEPMQTVASAHGAAKHRAFLVNESSTMEVRPASLPATTQLANGRNGGQGQKAYLEHGRVVKMTPRALARFQSFPDTYILPEKASLACLVIGNAVPPLLYEAVLRAQTELFA